MIVVLIYDLYAIHQLKFVSYIDNLISFEKALNKSKTSQENMSFSSTNATEKTSGFKSSLTSKKIKFDKIQ